MTARARRRALGEAGFTLVELLVGMVLLLLVLGATLTLFEGFQRDAGAAVQRNDAQDLARATMDRLVRQLRGIASSRSQPTPIERATPWDLVFQTISPTAPGAGAQNTAGLERIRYCVPPDSSSGTPGLERLFAQTETWTAAGAPAMFSSACPDPNYPSTDGADHVTNRLHDSSAGGTASRPLFTYDSATLGQISSIGVTLYVQTHPGAANPRETQLSSGVFLRNQDRPPVPSFTATFPGGGHVLLNGSSSYDPDNQPITYAWFDVTGGQTPSSSNRIGTGSLVDYAAASGQTLSIALQVTDDQGVSSTTTQAVSVP